MTEFNTPSHYVLSDGSDSMDALEKILGPEEFKGFLRGNAIKYLIRYKQKGGIGDLKKAMDYIARLEAVEEDEEKEREFIKKSNPLLYKDEAERKAAESRHSHNIEIPPHRFLDKKDGDHSHDIKIPVHCYVKKNWEEPKRYIFPLPMLKTTDGERQYLTYAMGTWFACRRNKKLLQTWEEKDIKLIPEEYRHLKTEER